MEREDREALEAALQAAFVRGELRAVATRILEAYGPEIVGFLVAVLRDHDDAADAFAQASLDLWRGLPGYRAQASFRTWAYTIARNAAHRHRRDPLRRRGVALTDCPEVDAIEQRVRTTTLTYLRSEVRDRVSMLRDALDEEERMLLILRIDRDMAWSDIADVMLAPKDDAERARASASLRKRFERVKDRLRALAKDAPLVAP